MGQQTHYSRVCVLQDGFDWLIIQESLFQSGTTLPLYQNSSSYSPDQYIPKVYFYLENRSFPCFAGWQDRSKSISTNKIDSKSISNWNISVYSTNKAKIIMGRVLWPCSVQVIATWNSTSSPEYDKKMPSTTRKFPITFEHGQWRST